MKTKFYVFENNSITFTLDRDSKVMVNATEMAKVFNAKVNHFMENESTKAFIESCLKSRNSGFLNIEKEDDLYVSRQKSGTFMHRILALKFAAWLNSDFEVWVYSTIDKLLFGRHAEREKSFERTIALQKEMEDIVNKSPRTAEDFDRYLEIERELKRECTIRKSLTVESVCEMKDLFENQEI
jgi:hypothetical protein